VILFLDLLFSNLNEFQMTDPVLRSEFVLGLHVAGPRFYTSTLAETKEIDA
jgi:hypothetical protein